MENLYRKNKSLFERVKTWSGNEALYGSMEKHLARDGYIDRGVTIHRSRSSVGTISFYIEDAERGMTIKVSDHITIGQQRRTLWYFSRKATWCIWTKKEPSRFFA